MGLKYDLETAKDYLKQVHTPRLADQARVAFVTRVIDAAIGSLGGIKKSMPVGRTWTDVNRNAVQKLAQKCDLFRDARLTADQINFLYDVVVDENEGWDGEEVEPKHVLSCMVARYTNVGLIPSRN